MPVAFAAPRHLDAIESLSIAAILTRFPIVPGLDETVFPDHADKHRAA
jgi:hypothetical protein